MACLCCCGRKKKPSKKMSDKKFVDECLKEHNECRKRHGVPSLKLNKDMTAIAQKWADHLGKSNTFSHSNDRTYKGDRMGENIAMKWTSSGDNFSGQQCVQQWYEEVQRYDFGRNNGPSTGHFTQVVWKDSRELGVGRAQTADGKWLVVCNYLPAGNMMGRNAENVMPPKDGKIVLAPKGEARKKAPAAKKGKPKGADKKAKKTSAKRSKGTSSKKCCIL